MFWSRTKEAVPYTALEAIRVDPELEAEFLEWDRRYTEASLMGFLITPFVMRYVLGWWLNPPPTASPNRTRNGILLVVSCYVVFLLIFSVWPT